ncbi:YCF48-related protein [Chryseobacterium tructae]|uniref:YCF48-related protein n=1 Tax=Chryseobacterium tructae TaxID=1037380 RepID=A0ABV7Y4N8_9FLAO|nr:YCF48-related protein [Chryseobacterium tructae]MDN3694814.1 YCF48-related protein [Chryseobacterium tructae]
MHKYFSILFLSLSSIINAQEWKFLTPVKGYSVISNLEVTPNQTLYLLDNTNHLGIVASSKDSGTTWRKLFKDGALDIQMLNDNVGFVLKGHQIFKTTNAFTTSTPYNVGGDFLNKMYFVNESVGFVCGNIGVIYKTINGGTNFTPTSLSTNTTLNDVFFINPNIGFVSGNNGTLYKTTNQGATWTATSLNTTGLEKILFINDTEGYVTGNTGGIFKTTDQGNTWTALTTNTQYRLFDIKYNAGKLYAVGQDNRLLKSSDMGQTWTQQRLIEAFPYNELYSIAFINNNIMIGGKSNIYKSTDGTNWSIQVPGVYNSSLKSISFGNDDKGTIVGNQSGFSVVYYTENGGYNWVNKKATFTLDAFKGVHVKENGKGVLIANGGHYFTSDFGKTWDTGTTTNHPTFVSPFWLKNNGDLLLGTASPYSTPNNGIHLLTNSYTSHFTPTDKVETIQFYNDMIGYAGTYKNLYKTTDGGLTWNIIYTLPTSINYINIINANKIQIGTDTGEYYISNNAGSTWTENTSNIRYHYIDELTGYYFDSGFNIYRTTDGGLTSQLVVPENNDMVSFNAIKYFKNKIIAVGTNSDIFIVEFPNQSLGTNETEKTKDNPSIQIYPNPTTSSVYFKTPVALDKVQVYDIQGKIMAFTKESNGINISQLEPGVYFVKFESNGKWFTQKIIKN